MPTPPRVFRAFIAASLMLALFAIVAPVSLAAGSSSVPKPAEAEKTPEALAIEHYNNGIANRDQAWKIEQKIAEAPADMRDKLEKKLVTTFESAAREFREATRQNPAMHQAYSGLGYALRRTGDFEASLEAYNKALSLEPEYTEAIEYRAEAYLALNRIDEAKAAYDVLVELNQQHATELLQAMKKWIGQRKADPAGLSTQQVNEMERWIEQRASTMSDKVGHVMPRKDGNW